MKLGPFSLSLSVKDIHSSLSFYQKLGFEVIDGGHTNTGFKDTDTTKWRILSHDSVKIGLFQGMFEQNLITFNPQDVMGIQEMLKAQGVNFDKEASLDSPDGLISAALTDPDGNMILLDQAFE